MFSGIAGHLLRPLFVADNNPASQKEEPPVAPQTPQPAVANVKKTVGLFKDRLLEQLKVHGFEKGLALFDNKQLSKLAFVISLTKMLDARPTPSQEAPYHAKVIFIGQCIEKGEWSEITDGFRALAQELKLPEETSHPLIKMVGAAAWLAQQEEKLRPEEPAVTLEDVLELVRALAKAQESLSRKLRPVFTSIEKELRSHFNLLSEGVEAVKGTKFKSPLLTRFFENAGKNNKLINFHLKNLSNYFSVHRDQLERKSFLFCSEMEDDEIRARLPLWLQNLRQFREKSGAVARAGIQFMENKIDFDTIAMGQPITNERTDERFKKMQDSSNEIRREQFKALGDRIQEIADTEDFKFNRAHLIYLLKTGIKLIDKGKCNSEKKVDKVIYEWVEEFIQKTMENTKQQRAYDPLFQESDWKMEVEKKAHSGHLKNLLEKIVEIAPKKEKELSSPSWKIFMSDVATNIKIQQIQQYKLVKQRVLTQNKETRVKSSGMSAEQVDALDKNSISICNECLGSMESFNAGMNLLFGSLQGQFLTSLTYLEKIALPSVKFSWQELSDFSTKSAPRSQSRGKRFQKRKALPDLLPKVQEDPVEKVEVVKKEVVAALSPSLDFFESVEHSLMSGVKGDVLPLYERDAVYHLFHCRMLLEMIQRERGNLELLLPQLDNALNLAQEQVVTPRYVEMIQQEVVTHNLERMNKALGITTPFSSHWASRGFRYPHSQVVGYKRYKGSVPPWLQAMVTNKVDPAKDVAEAKSRAKVAFSYISALAGLSLDEKKEKVLAWIDTDQIGDNETVNWNNEEQKLLDEQAEKLEEICREVDSFQQSMSPEVEIVWNDLKLHVRRLLGAISLMKSFPEQKFLTLHAQAVLMSGQYCIEHCGMIRSELEKDQLHTHSLKIYSDLYDWSASLPKENLETLTDLDIQKGSDYPNWGTYCHQGKKLPEALELLNRAYSVSRVADQSGEGFQAAGEASPTQVRAQLLQFLKKEVDLIQNLLSKCVIPETKKA